MQIADLTETALRRRLRGPGLSWRIGPLTVSVRSRIEDLVNGIAVLYHDYPTAPDDAFVDFHVHLRAPSLLRRWLRPLVVFDLDGHVPFTPLSRSQAFPMLEWGLNWATHAHLNQHLVLHAAVVERDGFAAVLPGASGSGKSTLCAALIHRGWRLFSDELGLLARDGATLSPMPRPVSLKNESIAVMRRFAPEAVIGPETRDTNKGTVAHVRPPVDSIVRWSEPAAPAWLIFPSFEAGAAPSLTPLSKGQTALRLSGGAFNTNVLGPAGFQALTGLVDRCDCLTFSYGDLDDAIKVFDALSPPAAARPRLSA